ncbi:MAG: hypothetical protein DWQ01_10885 [Planctomycetota bacterium]|nr:MAG: hypothetical protein DWQ01_10885 [Planctomycetota bacterium]
MKVTKVAAATCLVPLALLLSGGQEKGEIIRAKLGNEAVEIHFVSSKGTGKVIRDDGFPYLKSKSPGFWLIESAGFRASMAKETRGDIFQLFGSHDVFGNLTSRIPQYFLPKGFPYLIAERELLEMVLKDTALIALEQIESREIYFQVEGFFYEGITMERAFKSKEKNGSFELIYLLRRSMREKW